jgi:hypothetical protein
MVETGQGQEEKRNKPIQGNNINKMKNKKIIKGNENTTETRTK